MNLFSPEGSLHMYISPYIRLLWGSGIPWEWMSQLALCQSIWFALSKFYFRIFRNILIAYFMKLGCRTVNKTLSSLYCRHEMFIFCFLIEKKSKLLQCPTWLEMLCTYKLRLSLLCLLDHMLVIIQSVIVTCKKTKFWKSNTKAYITLAYFVQGFWSNQISLEARKDCFHMILHPDLLYWNINATIRWRDLLMAMRLLAASIFPCETYYLAREVLSKNINWCLVGPHSAPHCFKIALAWQS